MTLKDDLDRYVKATFRDQWKVTDTDVVPDPEDLPLGNEAIRLDATVLYADLADSTALVRGHKPWFAAEKIGRAHV